VPPERQSCTSAGARTGASGRPAFVVRSERCSHGRAEKEPRRCQQSGDYDGDGKTALARLRMSWLTILSTGFLRRGWVISGPPPYFVNADDMLRP
jgi:hypothetical protein